jgi:hypothetical protein
VILTLIEPSGIIDLRQKSLLKLRKTAAFAMHATAQCATILSGRKTYDWAGRRAITFYKEIKMKLSALIAAIAVCAALATASYAQPHSDTLEQAPPDFVAGVLGKLVVAAKKCGLQTNDFPLKRAVAKLGWILDDFEPEGRYADLVERALYQALDRVGLSLSAWSTRSAVGQPQACAAIRSEVTQSLPDIVAGSAP